MTQFDVHPQPALRKREALIVLALLGLGLVVYLVGVTHDLPYAVQRDEYGIYAFTSAQIAVYEETLPRQAELLHVIAPTGFEGGPVVRVYRLAQP